MKRTFVLGAVFTAVMVLVLPFVGGGGPSFLSPASAAPGAAGAVIASSIVVTGSTATGASASAITSTATASVAVSAPATVPTTDSEHLAQKPVPKPVPVATGSGARSTGTEERRTVLASQGLTCPGNVGGSAGGAPGATSPLGVAGTTSGDLASFAAAFNAIRVANCLQPIPMANFRYDACMEQRLFWMAEDPSTDPASAWGHIGSVRSDGVPSVGCDGNLAGGSGNTGATVAQKWWNSIAHRNSLYRPSFAGSTAGVCIYLAMTHGGVPNEPYSFTRAAGRWGGC